ncbi:DUF4349 domain-containing protein [Actinoplanes sp. RD1]|uniref:DUF4349 domain-containing protein n=1 Tax=Actinoplanes sp. RD1 TaxID=3064538 RepID=UPI0027416AF6|nr:DUF4349 domain-containing protein [Actinoplanes sp. RD1]
MRTSRWWAAAAVVLALSACTSGASDDSSTVGAAGVAEQPAAQKAEDTPAKAPDLSVDQRAIIYTGSITVRVDDVNAAAARTTGIVAGAKGFIGGDQRTSNGADGSSDATLTLRVPAAGFGGVIDQLAGLGTEEKRAISTEDVTDESVDLDARIKTQQARVDSGRTLLAQAKDLEDLVMLEREVATRESDLASLQAKQRRLADLTALSTITLVLLDPSAEEDEPAQGGFLGGLRGGWHGFTTSLGVAATVLGYLLPWLAILAVPVAVIIVRRRKARTA